jgi:3-methyladenine DNA glycosylase AlkC
MKLDFSQEETNSARSVLSLLLRGDHERGLAELRQLVETIHFSIPAKQRISHGITWVMQRAGSLLVSVCSNPDQIRAAACELELNLAADDRLMGVPIFLMAEYGKTSLPIALDFYTRTSSSDDWIVREFTAIGFRRLIHPESDEVFQWLKTIAQSTNPNLRRLVGETLRPVAENRWLNKHPQMSLDILRHMFREAHPYPRTSVGNNLSDLSKSNPELIQGIVQGLVASRDKNGYWIAYRACRNMVKKNPDLIMQILGVDEYHYKDRNFFREDE